MKTSLYISFLFISSLVGNDHWDGKFYHKNSSSQKDAATDLLEHIEICDDEVVLDIGCGDGKITNDIQKKLVSGSTFGIDISPSMITFAKDHYKEVSFFEKRAENFSFDKQFDKILSFTAMQWIGDHASTVQNIHAHLKDGGKYGVTMPMGLPSGLKKSVESLIQQDKWSVYFDNFDSGWNFVSKEEYALLLEKNEFSIDYIDVVISEDIFPSYKAFKGFISGWFPYLRPLPEDKKELFLSEALLPYLHKGALDREGRVHFVIDRLEVVASKLSPVERM